MLLILLDKNGGFLGGEQPMVPPGVSDELTVDLLRRYADDLRPPQYVICEGSVEQDRSGDMAGRRSGTWRVLHHQRGREILYNFERGDPGWWISGTLDEHGHFIVAKPEP